MSGGKIWRTLGQNAQDGTAKGRNQENSGDSRWIVFLSLDLGSMGGKESLGGKRMLSVFGHVQGTWQWHPTPVLLPGKSNGWRSLVGCSLWGRWESDTTERLHFDFSLSCIGEGNGNPLQCSCLENPRDGGALWAAVYGVAQSQTWLKRLSSSSKGDVQEGVYRRKFQKGV